MIEYEQTVGLYSKYCSRPQVHFEYCGPAARNGWKRHSGMFLSRLVGPWLAPISPVLSVAAVTALVTIAMTWAVMPVLARLFVRWLYP